MKKNLRTVKTTIIIGILLISVFSIMIPVSSVKAQASLFGYASVVDITWIDANESSVVIKPHELKSFKLNVAYSITRGPFGRLIYSLFYTGRRADIKLEIIDYPDWSNVYLPTNTITIPLQTNPTKMVEKSITIMIGVAEDAPAFMEGIITIRATVAKIGFIDGFSKEVQIPFKPDYSPKLNIVPLLGDKIKISPYNESKIPIDIQNLGNGRTRVIAEIENASENMNVSIENTIIDVGETKQIFLTVIADHKFDVESIKLKFTPAWSENPDLKGESSSFILSFINDGSYKEDLGFKIDITMIITVIVIIILIIISILLLKRRK
jgi:hypothetical protein